MVKEMNNNKNYNEECVKKKKIANVKNKRLIKCLLCVGVILFIPVILIILILLKNVNPATNNLFPPCIFYELTGFQCAGCGVTRATHQILNLNFKEAFFLNPLIFFYIILFFLALIRVIVLKIQKKDVINVLKKELNKFLYVLLVITLTFMILRNILNLFS